MDMEFFVSIEENPNLSIQFSAVFCPTTKGSRPQIPIMDSLVAMTGFLGRRPISRFTVPELTRKYPQFHVYMSHDLHTFH